MKNDQQAATPLTNNTSNSSLAEDNCHTDHKLILKVSSLLRKNKESKYYKPCEDYLIAENEQRIFILMDGATRFVKDAGVYPDPSPSSQAARIICDVSYSVLKSLAFSEANYQMAFSQTAIEANAALKKYNDSLFPIIDYLENDYSSAGGVISAIRNGYFLYSYIADPQIYLIRDHQITLLRQPQTCAVEDFIKELHRRGITDPAVVQKTVCKAVRNTQSSPYRFGVFTGEESALPFLQFGSVKLENGDKILLTSDGLAPVWEHDRDVLLAEELEFILDAADRIDKQRNLRSDDKAAILIEVI